MKTMSKNNFRYDSLRVVCSPNKIKISTIYVNYNTKYLVLLHIIINKLRPIVYNLLNFIWGIFKEIIKIFLKTFLNILVYTVIGLLYFIENILKIKISRLLLYIGIISLTFISYYHLDIIIYYIKSSYHVLIGTGPSSPVDPSTGGSGIPGGSPGGSPGGNNSIVLAGSDSDSNSNRNLRFMDNILRDRNRYTSSPVEEGDYEVTVSPDNKSMSIKVPGALNSIIVQLQEGFKIPVLTEATEITRNTVGSIPRPTGGFLSAFNHILLFTQPVFHINHISGISEYIELGIQYRFLPINSLDIFKCEVILPDGKYIIYTNFADFYCRFNTHKSIMLGSCLDLYNFENVSEVMERVNKFIETSLSGDKSPAPYIIRHYSRCLS